MKVGLWAEIRRLQEIERLSARAVARRLRCSTRTVSKALDLSTPPTQLIRQSRKQQLDPYLPQIDALIEKYPELSAVRVREEISRGPGGYSGSVYAVRRYLRKIRPARGRVYQEVDYKPGQAMQVDWGTCGNVVVGQTRRRVSVFVAVLCYSRMIYIEFTLSQRKAEFYRCIVNALHAWDGRPGQIIVDNLKAAVLHGSGRNAVFHPEFLALCGHFYLEPVACERSDPESKGIVEGGVRYVKRNALEGREPEFTCFEDYVQFAPTWCADTANIRPHETTNQRPVDRFMNEGLRALPQATFDTDEIIPVVASPHARVRFDTNRYSVPPEFARRPATLRASRDRVRVIYEGREIACHARCYDKRQILCLPEHQLAAIEMRRRRRSNALRHEFDALGPEAQRFHLALLKAPIKAGVHLRRLMGLVRVYGRTEVLAAISQALEYQTYDAAYVESLLQQQRRRRQIPTPLPPCPKRRELIDDIALEEPDPGSYDRLFNTLPGDSDVPT